MQVVLTAEPNDIQLPLSGVELDLVQLYLFGPNWQSYV